MILVIAGGRDYVDEQYFFEYVEEYLSINGPFERIISGGANGADSLARKYCLENNIPFEEYPAPWDLFGKSAGPIRNKKMATVGTHLLAFWDGESRGTKNMIDEAYNFGLKVEIVEY